MHYLKKLLILVFLFSITANSQKNFTLEQVINDPSSLSPKKLLQLQWITKSESFSYIEELGDNRLLVTEPIEEGNKNTLTTLSELNRILKENGLEGQNDFPLHSWYSEKEIWFWVKNKLVLLDIDSKSVKVLNEISERGENQEFIVPEKIAYTFRNNLYISINKKQIQITKDEDEAIVNGQSVHRVEFGIKKGIFWSPDANYLAFYRKDETMVTDYPILDISKRPAKVYYTKYPMAGMSSHQVKVGIYNVNTGETIWLETGEPKDKYLPGVTWSPDEKYVFINELNRDQNHLKFSKYDVRTGKLVKVLFEEVSEKYVEPMQGPIFFKDEPAMFLWLSRNEGWNHLSLYDAAGIRIVKMTKGEWEITDFDGFDNSGTNVYFTSTEISPLDRHYYKLSLDNYETKKLTYETGVHNVTKHPSGRYFLDEFSNASVPYQVDLVDKDGEKIRTVYQADNPFADYNIGETRLFSIKNKYDDELFCRMILPPAFKETDKYPLLLYVYGGPHCQRVTNSWLGKAKLWLNYMAQNGFIVFTLDNRGSANRGLEFEQEIFRRLGTVEIEDQLSGVEYLKSLPYVDPDRMGVYGWSYGGFMTASLMTKAPDIFKVGVAGAPVIDWGYYEVMYTERYMDMPQTNPEGYKNSNLLNFVENLKGKLLLVHGTSDPTVVWQHTLLFAEKAANLGIDVDYYPYIGHQHSVKGKDMFHLFQKITNYFIEHLK